MGGVLVIDAMSKRVQAAIAGVPEAVGADGGEPDLPPLKVTPSRELLPKVAIPLSRKEQRAAENRRRHDIKAVAAQWSKAIEEGLLSSLALDGRVVRGCADAGRDDLRKGNVRVA
jgi:hypothetical protein